MRAVILAGGAGRGLKVITGGRPKTLVPLAGKPVIEYVIETLIKSKITEITLVTDRPSEFEDITVKYGMKVRFDTKKQEGNEVIGALLTAKEELSKGSILFYGDTLTEPEAVQTLLTTYLESGDPTLLLVPEEDVTLYGAVKVSEGGLVKEIIEKPGKPLEGYYAFGGLAILNAEIMNLIESYGALDKALNEYIRKGGKVRAAIWGGLWVDIGYPWDILTALYNILSRLKASVISSRAKVSSKAVIEGPVIIEDNAVIEHGSIVRGPAYIGRDVLLGVDSFIRPYTSIEYNASIASYAEIVWSSIQPEVTIGRASFLGYSVVGPKAVVEPFVLTKIVVEPEKVGIKAIREYRRRREYFKIGSFIGYRARVRSFTILEPGTTITTNP